MRKVLPALIVGAWLLAGAARGESVPVRRYSDDHRLIYEGYMDADGRSVTGPEGYAALEIRYSPDGLTSWETYLDVHGNQVPDANGVYMVLRTYDALGHVRTVRRCGRFAEAMPDPKTGAYMVSYRYDASGRVSECALLDEAGESMPGSGHWAFTRYQYDALDRLTEQRWFDERDKPTLAADYGAACARFEYDENDFVCRIALYDGRGRLATGAQGWAIQTVERDDAGRPLKVRYLGRDKKSALASDGTSGVDYAYDARGNVVYEAYYNAKGRLGANRQGFIIVERTFDEADRLIEERTLKAPGKPMKSPETGAEVQKITYDSEGRISEVAYFSADGAPMNGIQGYSVARYGYDEAGNRTSERYTNAKGKPTLLDGDYSGVDRTYDGRGNVIFERYYDKRGEVGANRAGVISLHTEYDGQNRPVLLIYTDRDDQPMRYKAIGAYRQALAYDDRGNVSLIEYRDDSGRPMTGKDGWATARYTYDAKRRTVAERYFGPDGEGCRCRDGYAGIDRLFDEEGNLAAETCYAEDGQAGPNKQGVTRVRRWFDASGRALCERYYDADDLPCVVASRGAASIVYAYDDEGRVVRESAFAADGSAMISLKKKCACVAFRYDEWGHVSEERWYGTDGAPVLVGRAACVRRTWDEEDRLLSETFFGVDGRLAPAKDGYASRTFRYDASGRVAETTFYGTDGAPMALKGGYARVVYRYDDQDRVICEQWFDAKGQPLEGAQQAVYAWSDDGKLAMEAVLDAEGFGAYAAEGWSAVRYEYDPKNRVRLTRYYGPDGAPMALEDGAAAHVTLRDDAGNICLECALDLNDAPIVTKKGYAMVERRYNAQKKVVRIRYLDAGGAPVDATDGYSQIVYDYDAAGNRILESTFDASGARVAPARKGYASVVRGYDDRKRQISERTCDVNGLPAVGKMGYAGFDRQYSEDGCVVLTTYVGPDGKVMQPNKKQPYVKLRQTLDAVTGKVVLEEYLDEAGQPTVNAQGVAATATEYDDQGCVVRKTTYDVNGRVSAGRKKFAILEYTYDSEGNKTTTRLSASGRKVG